MRALVLISMLCIAGCGASAGPEERPTPTPLATKTEPAQTFVSTDGMHFVPGEPAKRADVTLTAVAWRQVRFTRGVLTLAGLGRPEAMEEPSCPIDHVAIGPAEGEIRRVTVMAPLPDTTCEPGPRRIVLQPQGWTKRTIAAPGELDVPNRALTDQVRLAGVYGSGVLQPDRRSIVVEYRSGGCHDLARVHVSMSGAKIRVSVFDGTRLLEDDDDVGCPGIAYTGHTLVRLPNAVSANTPVVVCDRKWPPCE